MDGIVDSPSEERGSVTEQLDLSKANLKSADSSSDEDKQKAAGGWWGSGILGFAANAINSLIGYQNVEVVDPEGSETDADKEKEKGRFKPEERAALWSMMHKYIGADVTSLVTLPVYLFEPMSQLQKMAELMEYTTLLDKAAVEKDPHLKLALAGAWAISCYWAYKRTWKPFNPILGETYELWDHNDIVYIAEQVSHHPPMGVAHGEHRLWTYDCTSMLKAKFMGNYLEVNPVGQTRVTLKPTNEILDLVPPPTKVHNLIFGRTWVDTCGDMILTNVTTGDKATMYFQPCGWFGSGRYEISGFVCDRDGVKKIKLWGKWSESFHCVACDAEGEPLQDAEEVTLWTLAELPVDDKYGFTQFAHKITNFSAVPEVLLHSDSRIRPDRLQLQRGDASKAGPSKYMLEEHQRAEKRERDAKKDKWTPRWFKPTGEVGWHGELPLYEFTGEYLKRAEAIKAGTYADGIRPPHDADRDDYEFCPWQYTKPASSTS